MHSKIISKNNYDISIYNTDKFKSIELHLLFRLNRSVDDYLVQAIKYTIFRFNKIYKSRREMAIQEEELYNEYFNMASYRKGKHMVLEAYVSIINPELVKDDYLKDAIKYLFDLIYNPLFDDKSLKYVKDRMNTDYNRMQEKPVQIASLNAYHLFMDGVIERSDLIVDKETVDSITIDDLERKYNEIINNSNLGVYVLGDVSKYEDEIVEILDSNIKTNNCALDEYKINVPYVDKVKEETDYKEDIMQTQLFMIYNTPLLEDKLDKYKLNLFSIILGDHGQASRLFNNVREKKQVCYVISSSYDATNNCLRIYSGTNTSTLDDTIEEIKKTLDSMRSITDEELENAKTYYINQLDGIFDDMFSIYRKIMHIKEYNCNDVETDKKLIMKVTKEDIQNLVDDIKLNTLYVLKGDK